MSTSRTTQTHGLWTPANIVTCARVVLVPVWVAYALAVGPVGSPAGTTFAGFFVALFFGLLALTDKLDGYLARSRGEITNFGKFLDPIADKLVVVCAFLVLMQWGLVSPWIIIVIIAREFLVSGLRMLVAAQGIVLAASNLGKWKTATTMICIVGFLLAVELPLSPFTFALTIVSQIFLLICLILTIWSGLDYLWKSRAVFALSEDGNAQDAGSARNAGGAPRAEITYDAGGAQRMSDTAVVPTWDAVVERAAQVLETAREHHITLGTAESCTGGLVEGALTAVPGSSDVVQGAIGSYAVSVKAHVLGVPSDILNSVGPVSSECARAMAEGARRALGCDVALSVTGIAGPGGEEPGKPVGFVWFGVATPTHTHTECVTFPGNRAQVRLGAVMHALELAQHFDELERQVLPATCDVRKTSDVR